VMQPQHQQQRHRARHSVCRTVRRKKKKNKKSKLVCLWPRTAAVDEGRLAAVCLTHTIADPLVRRRQYSLRRPNQRPHHGTTHGPSIPCPTQTRSGHIPR
jgi:hypothetical protein